jgi:hypothetical protein
VDAEPSRPSTNAAALRLLKGSFVEFRYAFTHLLIVSISRSPTSPVLALVYLSSSLFRLLKGFSVVVVGRKQTGLQCVPGWTAERSGKVVR